MKQCKIYRFIASFLFATLLSTGAQAVRNTIPYPNTIHIITLGDSFMTGHGMSDDYAFSEILGRRLRMAGYKNIQMINMADDNDTALEAAQKIPQILTFNPHIVIITIGTNDIIQQKPLKQTYERLEFILQTLTEKKIKVILAGPPPQVYKEDPYKTKIPEIFNYLAYKYQVKHYPNFMDGVENRSVLLLDDKLHPNNRGIEVLTKNFKPIVEEALDSLPKIK